MKMSSVLVFTQNEKTHISQEKRKGKGVIRKNKLKPKCTSKLTRTYKVAISRFSRSMVSFF